MEPKTSRVDSDGYNHWTNRPAPLTPGVKISLIYTYRYVVSALTQLLSTTSLSVRQVQGSIPRPVKADVVPLTTCHRGSVSSKLRCSGTKPQVQRRFDVDLASKSRFHGVNFTNDTFISDEASCQLAYDQKQ